MEEVKTSVASPKTTAQQVDVRAMSDCRKPRLWMDHEQKSTKNNSKKCLKKDDMYVYKVQNSTESAHLPTGTKVVFHTLFSFVKGFEWYYWKHSAGFVFA